MDKYTVSWSARAARDMDRLDHKVAGAVIDLVYGALAIDPTRVGHRLRFELEGHYSARRGGWRLIYRVDEKKQLVHIERVGHRSDIYRRR
ncbi:MAG TPA: type II toxin-antitoxin system RelE/ParE family toxin [Acidimicrobiales bacterium]|nr:type II toxin-antitoxin system RelE/ParE family toxin [Acidimicrobiales bacterium]